MCGIVGRYNFGNDPVDQGLIQRMTRRLKYRGPDDEGYYFEGRIGLGHRRLAIVDLKTGHQPIYSEDKNIVVIFNGEIYNFLELKAELEDRHRFYTKTDTEVLVHLYEEEGADFLKRLNGDFAIALWDRSKRILILARDRIGIKPLFYYIDQEKIIFASEIKAILENKTVKKELNLSAMNDYFSYLFIPGPKTIFENIKKIPPGHYLKINRKPGSQGWHTAIHKYWELKPTQIKINRSDKKKIILDFRELLEDSIALRLIADVPVGVFLSGGIDSSSLVALISKLGVRPQTFSISCGRGIFNELPWARLVAKRYHTQHHEFTIKPDFVKTWEKLIEYFDEPYGNSSALPTFLVASLARLRVKVALSGEGGDEVLAGYSWHRFFEKCISIPFYRQYKSYPNSLDQCYQVLITYYSSDLKKRIYSADFRHKVSKLESSKVSDYFDQFKSDDPRQKALFADLKTLLPDDLLMKLDRMGMANSLEGRVPFLDHRLVEFLAGIPYSLKKNKYILRQAMSGLLPNDILNKKKRGMAIPISDWLRGDLKQYAREILLTKSSSDIFFNPAGINKMLEYHFDGKKDYGQQIFMLISYKIWENKYLKK